MTDKQEFNRLVGRTAVMTDGIRDKQGRLRASPATNTTAMTVEAEQPEVPDRRARRSRLLVPEMWAALAISVIWLVVLVAALFGPDLVSSNVGSNTRIPSAIIIAFFAWLATWVIARHGFIRRDDES